MSYHDHVRNQLLAQATPEQAATIMRREAVAQRVCRERGWDIDNLSIEQAMEVRRDPEWAAGDRTVVIAVDPEVLADPREADAYAEYFRRRREGEP